MARRRKAWVPWLLLAPGIIWLVIFFVVPLYYMARVSLLEPIGLNSFRFNWNFSNYSDAIDIYQPQFVRTILYSTAASLLCFIIGFPLAYVIAFRGGKWRTPLLLIVVLPFLTTYLVRTLAWQTIFDDSGPAVSVLTTIGIVPEGGHILATTGAVIAGITYNFLPFMILPIYASLERIDRSLLEAAYDLYASRKKVLLKVTLPLAAPGIGAGVLLTFIPASGDFINAQLLGSPGQTMIGNVIQSRYLELNDYPTAAALSFMLMAFIMLIIVIWTLVAGTESLIGEETR